MDADDQERKPYIFKTNIVDEMKELDLSHVKEERYREEIKKIISNYKPEVTRDVGIRAKIILTSDKPVVSRPRRFAPSERKEVNDLINIWLEEGIIRPSTSEYESPIVLIKKRTVLLGFV
ncbi:jg12377 [Pararge aegeria aegeria]|uniref:Jg12377 protein n=1 Tax=Pararge aegeria aegeria TaxID=348720 RepID=A0A8S4SC31_9NEOP|nr:jg12377 [Pararge aegeria aegeria]